MTPRPPQSPRTPAEPLAFTPVEARRAIHLTALLFALMLAAIAAIGCLLGSLSFLALPAALAVSAVSGTTGLLTGYALLPLATRLGHRLRHIRRLWVHALGYGLLGAAVGTVVGGSLYATLFLSQGIAVDIRSILLVALCLGALTAISTAGGWSLSAFLALRDDRRMQAGAA